MVRIDKPHTNMLLLVQLRRRRTTVHCHTTWMVGGRASTRAGKREVEALFLCAFFAVAHSMRDMIPLLGEPFDITLCNSNAERVYA